MKKLKTTSFWRYILVLVSMFYGSVSFSQDLAQANQLCGSLTEVNKAMAKQAGYDLESLCSQISGVTFDNTIIEPDPMVPRDTASSRINDDSPGELNLYDNFFNDILSNAALQQDPCLEPTPDNEKYLFGEQNDFSETDFEQEIILDEKLDSFSAIKCLKPFGYDLFANAPTSFAPATSIPVSRDYLLGPGDTLDILFYGKSNSTFSVEINREGAAVFPELGPVGLAGLTFGEAKEMLQARIATQVIGTQASISMGALRSMQVFVLGEAFNPGAYTVSSLSTITHALVSSGGISDIGTLRKIQLKRQGKLITTLDLYDLLLAGDISRDLRIQQGDVIYIPTVGELVSIDGEVLRPAIYELKGGESVQDLVRLAGGLGSKAYEKSARLQRINADGFVTIFDVDLTKRSDQSLYLRDGDHIAIDTITDYRKDVVSLAGNVRHEGDFAWREGMRVSDVISENNKLKPDTDMTVAIVVRELANSANIEVLSFSPEAVLSNPETKGNLELESRDRIIVLSAYGDRAEVMAPYVGKLKRQTRVGNLPKIVTTKGRVRFPGQYPLIEGMSMDDLIHPAGGLLDSAYSQTAEIARMDLSNPIRATSEIILSSLGQQSSVRLKPSDYVEFRTIPGFKEAHTITLEGEFVFPGVYAFDIGETLTSVIQRAGGFTDEAFAGGSVFLRENLREREERELERLSKNLQDDLAAQNLREANADLAIDKDQIALQEKALEDIASLEALGRLVIPLDEIVSFAADDILLRHQDRLLVPKLSQEVTVIGEVRRPLSYFYDAEFSRDDYIEQSGGLKLGADQAGIYVVKASGKVIRPARSWFKFTSPQSLIAPGDTIVVPLDTDDEKLRPLAVLSEASQIIYQLSLGAAAINSFKKN